MSALSDRWFRLRNRLLSDPRFHAWATRFPGARIFARRRASALFDLCAGFVYSQVLLAVVRLGLLEILREGPLTASELAGRLSLPPDAAQRLLDAATAIDLLERRGRERYGLGVHGASMLGNPSIAALVEHHDLLYRDLTDPVSLLRGGPAGTEISRFWSYAASNPATPTDAAVAAYSDLMSGSLALICDDILEAYPPHRHRCLLDVAGGQGAFVEAAAARSAELSLILFDLPPVSRRASARLARAGVLQRVTVVAGDVFKDPLPSGSDLVSLVRVLHDHDDAQALEILRAIRRALHPGGVLMIAEPMRETSHAEPMADAYFGFYLLAMGQGRTRTPGQISALLAQAGFGRARTRRTRRPMLCRLLLADAI